MGEVVIPPRVMSIVRDVAERNGIAPSDILGRSRLRKHVIARHEAIMATFALDSRPSSTAVGRWFDRDHTTVLDARRRHEERVG